VKNLGDPFLEDRHLMGKDSQQSLAVGGFDRLFDVLVQPVAIRNTPDSRAFVV
jgi:hypothetical protein